jgi:uncharacterized membrane protein
MWILCLPIGILSPVIFMLVGKDRPGVYASSMQAITFMIILFILGIALWVVSFILAFVTAGIGLFLMPIVGLAMLLLTLYVIIMGAVTSNKGEVFEPPLSAKFAHQWFKI